jgi:hypothetical protein
MIVRDTSRGMLAGKVIAMLDNMSLFVLSYRGKSCKIWRFHSGDYEECHLMGCYAIWLLQEPTFLRNVAHPYQSEKNKRARINDSSNEQPSSSPTPVTLIMEALNSSETSVLKRAAWCNTPEDGILIL